MADHLQVRAELHGELFAVLGRRGHADHGAAQGAEADIEVVRVAGDAVAVAERVHHHQVQVSRPDVTVSGVVGIELIHEGLEVLAPHVLDHPVKTGQDGTFRVGCSRQLVVLIQSFVEQADHEDFRAVDHPGAPPGPMLQFRQRIDRIVVRVGDDAIGRLPVARIERRFIDTHEGEQWPAQIAFRDLEHGPLVSEVRGLPQPCRDIADATRLLESPPVAGRSGVDEPRT